MPYDQGLAARLERVLGDRPGMTETRMFGGYGYLLHGNMLVGIWHDQLIIRVGLEVAERLAGTPNILPMDITGRAMRGWARVAPEGLGEDAELERFCRYALEFVASLPPKLGKTGQPQEVRRTSV